MTADARGCNRTMMIYQHRNRTQELVTIVLDGLHEDLNRVLKKPYVEAVEVQGKRDVYKPSPSPSPFTLTLTLTLTLALALTRCECAADAQKFAFRLDAANKVSTYY